MMGQGEIINQILDHERPYIGAFSSLAFGLCISNIINPEIKKTSKNVLFVCALIFFSTIIIIAAKLALFSIIVLSAIASYFYIGLRKKRLLFSLMTMLLVPLIGILSYIFIPSVQIRFDDLFRKKQEPRIFIWQQAIEVVNDNSFNQIWGTFSEKKTNDLLKKKYKHETQTALSSYWRAEATKFIFKNNLQQEFDFKVPYNKLNKESGRWWWIFADNKNFNTHNQFLGIYLSYGIIGLTLILFYFFLLIKHWCINRNFSFLLSIICLFLFMTFENVLAKQQGIFFFSLFSTIFFYEDCSLPRKSDSFLRRDQS